MNDPHVESLVDELKTDETLRFANPDPVEGDAGGFVYRLADGVLTVTMKEHYATQENAVATVYPFIRAWELDFALERGRRQLWFAFVRSKVIDRKRTPGTLGSVMATAEETSIAQSVRAIIRRHTYPAPPANFVASANVETLWTRYENQLLGREYLPAMGYFCLTVVEALYGATSGPARPRKTSGKRRRAAAALSIDLEVLEKLGELTTERGDPMTARKYEAGAPSRPLTAQEAAWIQAALRAIMRQVGRKPGATVSPLSMADLPSL